MLANNGHKKHQSEKEIKKQTTDIDHSSGERDTTRRRRRPHDYLEPEPDCGERGGNL